MALATNFGIQGANPLANPPKNPANPFNLSGSTPASQALSSSFKPQQNFLNTTASPSLMASAQAATTPLKKQTYTDPMGGTMTHEYHPLPKETGMLDNSGGTSNPNANYNAGMLQQNPQGTPVKDSQPQAPTYPGLIGRLSSFDPFSNPAVSDAYKKAQELNTQLSESRRNEAQAIGQEGLAPIPIGDQTGRQAVIRQQYEAQQAALGSQLQGQSNIYSAGFTGTGQQASALNQATGYAAPQLAGFNQQAFNPLTSQFGGGQGGSTNSAMSQLPTQGQSAVNSYAQQVKSGQMTRADAESRLQAYGVAGTNALNEVLGSNFNTNASNASGATTAIGQQINAAIPPANQALDALQQAFDGLSSFQQGGTGLGNVPILSGLVQNASLATGLGREAASAYQGALQEARSRIDAALVGSIGVNAAAAQANALLPDNMIPSEIPQKIAAAKQYLQNQLASYTTSGSQQPNSNAQSNSNSLYSF